MSQLYMNKRSFLKTVLGGSAQKKSNYTSPTGNITLNPYTGPWEFAEAAHLLRRTIFGPTKAQIDQSVQEGLNKTLDRLFEPQPLPEPPIYFQFENDPSVAVGSTWVNTLPDRSVQGLLNARRRSLTAWMMGLMKNSGLSIREKMVLFWHEHFPVNGINSGIVGYHYVNTLRANALGNFRTLVEEITITPAMLIFLNGDQNTLESPNENYGRELLELFTIGRGDLAAPGDYTNYTEQDVVEIARALTGWRARVFDDGTIGGVFIPTRHDTGAKQLSHRFDNRIIQNGGEEEYKTLIDIILQNEEVARYISRQLHIWFVSSDINPDVEANVIEPMAQIMIANGYNIQPVVKALLSTLR